MDTISYDNVLVCELGNGTTPFTDLDGLLKLIKNLSGLERSYIGLENKCHVHFTLDFKSKDYFDIDNLRNKLRKLSGFKKKGRGGMNNLVIKESQFNLEKYKELEQHEQKYYQYIYTFKEYDDTSNTSRIYNIPTKLIQQYKNDYWEMYRKIIKMQSLKKKQNSAKTKSLRESLKDFFQQHRKQKIDVEGKTQYLHMESMDYIKLVTKWYQVMGIEHSVTDCERRALMLIAMSQPDMHETIILTNLSNKFLY